MQQLDFYKGDFIADSPAVKKINITWIGNLNSAQLVLLFGGKFGFELKYAELNGRHINPTATNEIRTGDIKDALINGENALTVVYDYLWGNQTTITAFVLVDGQVATFQWPSITQFLQDISTRLKDATLPTLVLIGLVAAIVIAIAVILGRMPKIPLGAAA